MSDPEIWASPTTFVTGHLETADELNVVFRDNMNFLHTAKFARVYRGTSAQSITNNSIQAISFNTETADPWDIHSNSSNPSRITCPATLEGAWAIHAQVQFAANATGDRRIYLYKTGAELVVKERDPNATGVTIMDVYAKVVLAEDDYIEAMVYQNSGGNLDADFGSNLTYMEAEWIGAVA